MTYDPYDMAPHESMAWWRKVEAAAAAAGRLSAFLHGLADMETPAELEARRGHGPEDGEHAETLAWAIKEARALTGKGGK